MRNNRKIIRNWKVIKDNLTFNVAFNIWKTHKIDDAGYPIIAMRFGITQFIQTGVHSISDIKLSPQEAVSNKWEIVIPDDDAEEKTNKLRRLMKDNNFGGLRHDKIDNMSIEEMWMNIIDVISRLDKNNLYRISKHIIETGLYKKV
jgi:hypothetical protein